MFTNIEKLLDEYESSTVEWAINHARHRLGLNAEEDLPPTVSDTEAGLILDVKPATIQLWRCTGNKCIQYVKPGRSALNLTESVLRTLLNSGSNRIKGVAA